MIALGLGKTIFNSSACLLKNRDDIEILLTERLTRRKGSGAWPEIALERLSASNDLLGCTIAENRDVEDPQFIENYYNAQFPFYEYLKSKDLLRYTAQNNKNIRLVTHHLAHAYAAMFMSPFEKSIILVIDGAGSKSKAFEKTHPEFKFVPARDANKEPAEERSVYLMDNGKLSCVKKKWQTFLKGDRYPEHHFSEGLGTLYEKASEFIFNSKRSAGKVMGLAAYGKAVPIENSFNFLNELDWNLSFKGKSKAEWENNKNLTLYKNVAASVQKYFEDELIHFVKELKSEFKDYRHLIITGGCALNCTTNMKIVDLKIFDQLYIPPFPGDECISLGVAYSQMTDSLKSWHPFGDDVQHGYFGSKQSVPEIETIRDVFQGYEIISTDSIANYAAHLLNEERIIAWFQGRSESGPRALGNRSILARPDIKNLKNILNSTIKFRENFRPYGCSTLFEKAPLYFKVPKGFNNPFMSFATRVQDEYQQQFVEITHADGTSRMQTVRKGQNELFYKLIQEFGQLSGIYCLLNTSLNIMGEPIVETIADAKNFLDHVPVHGLAIGNFYIKKPTK